VPQGVLHWRDRLCSQKKSAAKVALKVSVVRSFFEYVKAAGVIPPQPSLDEAGLAARAVVQACGEGCALPAVGAG
jgi:hypothetical protein